MGGGADVYARWGCGMMTELTFMDGLWFRLGVAAADFALGLSVFLVIAFVYLRLDKQNNRKKKYD